MNPVQVLEVGSGGGQGPESITPWHGDLVTSLIIVGVTYRWPRGRNAAARLRGSESWLGDLPVRARGACGRAAGKPRRHRLTRSATLERRLAGPASARGPIRLSLALLPTPPALTSYPCGHTRLLRIAHLSLDGDTLSQIMLFALKSIPSKSDVRATQPHGYDFAQRSPAAFLPPFLSFCFVLSCFRGQSEKQQWVACFKIQPGSKEIFLQSTKPPIRSPLASARCGRLPSDCPRVLVGGC